MAEETIFSKIVRREIPLIFFIKMSWSLHFETFIRARQAIF